MRRASFLALLTAAAFFAPQAAAETVPLPRPRPAAFAERAGKPAPPSPAAMLALAPAPELHALPHPEAMLGPTACEMRLEAVAAFTPLPALMGPGACGANEVVRLQAVILPDRSRVAIDPPATLRCSMAEAVALWVREDVAPAARDLGAPLAAVAAYESFECRGRNRVAGARMSEHGRANALDVRGVRLADKRVVEWTAPAVPKDYRERMRASACARFNTVLGPGSDGHHEQHVHLDLAERRNGYKLCQWDVREPGPAAAIPADQVPLPPPRPTALGGPDRKPL